MSHGCPRPQAKELGFEFRPSEPQRPYRLTPSAHTVGIMSHGCPGHKLRSWDLNSGRQSPKGLTASLLLPTLWESTRTTSRLCPGSQWPLLESIEG